MARAATGLAAAGLGLALGGATAGAGGHGAATAPGTERMARRLAEIAAASDPARAPFLNRRRAELLRASLGAAAEGPDRLRLEVALGKELVLAGDTEEGIARLQEARRRLERLAAGERPAVARQISELLAVAYLRLGEQTNCLSRHTADSCLLPIRGEGVHADPRGASLAAAEVRELLRQEPGDLRWRWLLNLAHMLLGDYPQAVPQGWLIPPEAFAADFDLGRFRDVAPRVGLATVGMAGGSSVDDFDGDGHLDVVTSSSGVDHPLRFHRNDGRGRFDERTLEAGLAGEVGGLNLTHADYDNDGDLDLLVLRGGWLFDQGRYPSSLLRNRGDGTFEDVTEEAGVLFFHPTHSAAWGDFDNDGWLDLFVGHESFASRASPCALFHNDGDGTFTDVARAAGVDAVGLVKGVAWGDYNNDGLIDLYLSRFGERNQLFRNDGRQAAGGGGAGGAGGSAAWKFTEVTAEAGVAEPRLSFATWFWDYDNDGWEDLFVAPFSGFLAESLGTVVASYLRLPGAAERGRLYHNQGDGTFRDVTAATGLDRALLVMGANFGDLDNDGYLDCYLGTGEPSLATLVPNRMFRNDRGRAFQDVTSSAGVGHLQKGHGVSFADLDHDGDQDIRLVVGGAFEGDVYPSALFENPGHGNRWVTLRLVGVEANRGAIGARIRVRVRTAEGERSLYATVGTGGSFGASSLQQEIGLGQALSIVAVEVAWPGGARPEVFAGVEMDRAWRLRQGEGRAAPVAAQAIRLGGERPEAARPHHGG